MASQMWTTFIQKRLSDELRRNHILTEWELNYLSIFHDAGIDSYLSPDGHSHSQIKFRIQRDHITIVPPFDCLMFQSDDSLPTIKWEITTLSHVQVSSKWNSIDHIDEFSKMDLFLRRWCRLIQWHSKNTRLWDKFWMISTERIEKLMKTGINFERI